MKLYLNFLKHEKSSDVLDLLMDTEALGFNLIRFHLYT
jgi:hypothetical protein